jgi:hypothetical protein
MEDVDRWPVPDRALRFDTSQHRFALANGESAGFTKAVELSTVGGAYELFDLFGAGGDFHATTSALVVGSDTLSNSSATNLSLLNAPCSQFRMRQVSPMSIRTD